MRENKQNDKQAAAQSPVQPGETKKVKVCKPYRSAEEKKLFYDGGLHRLRNEQVQEFMGDLIADMMEIKPTKELIVHARRWLKLFPEHEDAPELVGKWLEAYGSNEAMYVAASYLGTVSEIRRLTVIVRAVMAKPRCHRRLYKLIEARLEQDPASPVWIELQPYKASTDAADKLVLCWLKLNQLNPHLALEISSVALFTSSAEVVESVLAWAETTGRNSNGIHFVLMHLMRGRSQAHDGLMPRITQFARTWVKEHAENEDCGRVYGDLIRYSKWTDDIEEGKSWYKKHASSKSAWCVLVGLLSAFRLSKQAPDPYVVEQAKKVLAKMAPGERTPVLVGSLVAVHPDQETIGMARQICMESPMSWLLAIMLRVAPDAELISKAEELLPKLKGTETESELLLALLKVDPISETGVKVAKRWMRKNPVHGEAGAIKSIVAERKSR